MIRLLCKLLTYYRNIKTCSLGEEMKGILGDLGVMRIPLKEGAKSVKQ